MRPESTRMVKDATLETQGINSVTAASATTSSVDEVPMADKANASIYWPQIVNKDQIPLWLRDNDFLLTGHPMPTYSYKKSFRLWRCLHMETMNIWTHVLGSAAFVATGLGLYTASRATHLNLTSGDVFAFGIATSAAAVCFGLSATFHTLRSHSYHVHHFWGRLDIFGICLLAVGGGSSASYYAWMCDTRTRNIYLGLNAGAAVAAAATLFNSGGGGNKMRALRGGVFILLAIAALLPIYHRVGVQGWEESCVRFGAQWYLAEAVSLLVGVSLFVARIPERLSPGTFDIFGHSHQLHHTFAVIGMAFHVTGLVTAYKYAQSNLHC